MNTAVTSLQLVLDEALDGPSRNTTYFIDNRVDGGLLKTLVSLDAAQASKSIGGTSIAAHAFHTAFGMEVVAAHLEGDREKRDWRQSWSVSAVDEAAWNDLQAQVAQEASRLRKAIALYAGENEESLAEAIGGLVHIAYHMGAIRQKFLLL